MALFLPNVHDFTDVGIVDAHASVAVESFHIIAKFVHLKLMRIDDLHSMARLASSKIGLPSSVKVGWILCIPDIG